MGALSIIMVSNGFESEVADGIKSQLVRGSFASDRSDLLLAPPDWLARGGRRLAERLRTDRRDVA